MWRTLLPALLLLYPSQATYYSESGPQEVQYRDEDNQYYSEQLAEILEELTKAAELERARDEQREAINEKEAGEGELDIELANTAKQLADVARAEEAPLHAQKKGQNEFVEFVEPKASNQLKHVETVEKRVPAEQKAAGIPIVHTGNLVFIAVATVCVVASVVGVVGGAYYYHAMKSQQIAAEKSDFTHYAPAGPGKEKKKKRGDEGLAYKAQLHHYQQTKQKIISGEEQGAGIPDHDETSDASDDEANNFSVYECPGLAPTGDIEVQNPNFNSQP